MVISVLALFGALGIVLSGRADVALFTTIIATLALFQLFILSLCVLQGMKRLSKVDQKIAPGIFQVAMGDLSFRLYMGAICSISLLHLFLMAVNINYAAIHLVLFAVSMDLLIIFTQKFFSFSSVDGILLQFERQVERELKRRNPEAALTFCEAICQVGSSAVRDHNGLQGASALNTLYTGTEQLIAWAPLAQLFSSKYRIGADLPLVERLQVLVIYISQRVLWIMKDALHNNVLPIGEHAISFLGRVSCYLVNKHPEIAHVPMVQLMAAVQELSPKEIELIEVHLAVTFSEVIKTMLHEARAQKRVLIEPLMHLLRLLGLQMRESYQRKSGQNIALLMQPFAEIAEMLAEPEIAGLNGISQVKEELQRVFMQFSTLEAIQTGTFQPAAQTGFSDADSSSSFKQG